MRDFLPVRALTPAGSHVLFPEAWGAPGAQGRTLKLHQRTCEALLGKSLVLVSLATSPTGAALGGLPASPGGGAARGGRTDRWGGRVGLKVGLSGVQRGRNRERWGHAEEADVRMGLWNLSTNTLHEESSNQGLREGIQVKIKSSHRTCIMRKSSKIIYIYTCVCVCVCVPTWRSKYRGRSQSGERVRKLILAPSSCLTGCRPWGQTEGSRAETGMCGVEAGIVCCLGGADTPQVSFRVPLGSDCLAQGGGSGLGTRREPGWRTRAWGPLTLFLLSRTGPGLPTPAHLLFHPGQDPMPSRQRGVRTTCIYLGGLSSLPQHGWSPGSGWGASRGWGTMGGGAAGVGGDGV